MLKIRSFLLAILIMLTSMFGGCETDEETDEPPQVRDSGVQAGEAMAGESAGEESVAGTSDPILEEVVAGDLLAAGEEPQVAGEEAQLEPVCDETLPEGEDCEDSPVPAGDESSEDENP